MLKSPPFQDIADYFALRKIFTGNRWTFIEGRNNLNPASHSDISWADALATRADIQGEEERGGGAAVLLEDGSFRYFGS